MESPTKNGQHYAGNSHRQELFMLFYRQIFRIFEYTLYRKRFFMAAPRRKRCPHCGFLETIKWGRQGGHQRYKCKNCDTCFTSRRKDVSSANRFIWFKWWILRKQTVAEISQMSGHSSRQLSRWFDSYLRSYPEWEIKKSEKDINLLIDGTWFPNNLCLVLYRDETAKTTLFYRITDDERACEIVEDLNTIRAIGGIFRSAQREYIAASRSFTSP